MRTGLGLGLGVTMAGVSAPADVVTYYEDTFDGTVNTALVDHTPNTDASAAGYAIFGSDSFLRLNGAGGASAMFGTNGGHHIDTTQTDGVYRVGVSGAAAALNGGRATFKCTDADNHLQWNIEDSGAILKVYKHDGGVVTVSGSVTGLDPALTLPLEIETEMRTQVDDSVDYTVQVVGRPDTVIAFNDTFNATETHVGLWNSPAGENLNEGVVYTHASFKSA